MREGGREQDWRVQEGKKEVYMNEVLENIARSEGWEGKEKGNRTLAGEGGKDEWKSCLRVLHGKEGG